MDLPYEVPIIYSEQILIPGFYLKIKLPLENYANLLDYLRKNLDSKTKIGIIPKIDLERADNVIGTVGEVRSIIQISHASEEFFIFVLGIYRFKLDENVSEEPLKINNIIPITKFSELVGDVKEQNELIDGFRKALNDFLTYSDPELYPYSNATIKNILKKIPILRSVEFCLKNIMRLTSADAYEILRVPNLNELVKYIIQWLKQETIKANANSGIEKTGLVPLTSSFIFGGNKSDLTKRRLSPELQDVQTAIKNSNMPKSVNDSIMKEFIRLQEMSINNPEYSVSLQYISYVVSLPWNKSSIETLDLEKAKSVLKLNHYGMDKVKKRILQFIAVRILNPERRGPILCFVGPPGVGKTTIAKVIAESLNRKFKRISLGGINRVSDIKGHRKTYIGSMPGCIIQAVSQSQTKNPVILLDEIDKMYRGATGDPAAALLEVLDPEQNGSFVDSYVNLPFDLSQVMFVTTANNAAYIPQTLHDRMEMIHLDGYTFNDKIQIAENYLIPKILKEHKMNEVKITFKKNAISDIIQKYTHEAGVRDLQRKLEAICHFIAVEVVENADKKIKDYVITPMSLSKILGHETHDEKNILVEQCYNRIGVAIGLAWTPFGGKLQVIETSRVYSKHENKRLILTGLAGQTLRESVEIALNWIQSFVKKNEFNVNEFCVHVHFPEGARKVDGPSAGITVTCALISLFWQIPLKPMIAMTGEISLQGFVLPVGGVKQKILAAFNFGIKTIIIPEFNMKDTVTLPKNIKEDLNIIPVKHLEDVVNIVIPGGVAFLRNPSVNMFPRSKI